MLRGPLRAALPSLRDLPSETQSVSAAHSVNECRFVDDEEAVVELVGGQEGGRSGSRHGLGNSAMMRRAGGAIRRRWARLLRGCGHGLLPQRKGFPVCGNAHAAKDEWRCRFEQGMAAVLPFRFRANDAHAVGAERKNRECRRVGEARLAVEAFDERRELWGGTELSGNSCLHVSVPETRMVGADISRILERHEKSGECAWPHKECVGNCLLDIDGKSFVIKGDSAHRHVFKHGPHGRIVFDSVLEEKVPYVGFVFGLSDCGGNVGKKGSVLCCRYAGKVCVVDIGKWICIACRVELDDESAHSDFNPCEGIHRHQSKVAVKCVDVPYQVECSAGKVAVRTLCPERDKIARQTIVADRIEKMYCLVPVGDKVSRYEQVGQLFVGLWLLCKRNRLLHFKLPHIKMPAETIGRSLSGGVTGANYIKSRCQKQVGKIPEI